MKEKNLTISLNLQPIDPLPEGVQKYFNACQEKLGLVPNVLKDNAIHLLQGDSSAGKSFLTLEFASAISRGGELLGHKVKTCDLPHGGGQVIEHNGPILIGGSDPRKDGCAIGL